MREAGWDLGIGISELESLNCLASGYHQYPYFPFPATIARYTGLPGLSPLILSGHILPHRDSVMTKISFRHDTHHSATEGRRILLASHS
jgi:hypothetical protein